MKHWKTICLLAIALVAARPAFAIRDLETGTWLSKDPAGFVDGPNLYAYVNQNPWTKFDPLGLSERLGQVYDMSNEKSDYQGKVRENSYPDKTGDPAEKRSTNSHKKLDQIAGGENAKGHVYDVTVEDSSKLTRIEKDRILSAAEAELHYRTRDTHSSRENLNDGTGRYKQGEKFMSREDAQKVLRDNKVTINWDSPESYAPVQGQKGWKKIVREGLSTNTGQFRDNPMGPNVFDRIQGHYENDNWREIEQEVGNALPGPFGTIYGVVTFGDQQPEVRIKDSVPEVIRQQQIKIIVDDWIRDGGGKE